MASMITMDRDTAGMGGGGMSVYDRISEPLAFIEAMGRVFAESGAAGAKTLADGKLIALACMSKKIDPFELSNRYHLMDGKLTMKADVMLAEFRVRGGKHKWIKDGSDGKEAELELTYEGQTITSRFTMDDARRAALVKDKGGWTKNPANMLRARCTSNGVRMLAPEVCAGQYTPEEGEDMRSERAERAAVAENGNGNWNGHHGNGNGSTATDIAKRRAELLAMQAEDAGPGSLVDATFEVSGSNSNATDATATETAATLDVPASALATLTLELLSDNPVSGQILADIDLLAKHIGMTREELEAKLREANPAFTTIAELSEEAAQKLYVNLAAKVKAKK